MIRTLVGCLAFILLILVVFLVLTHAQDKNPSKLKDSVALEIRTQQVKLSDIRVQMLQLQQQFTQLQQQEQTINLALMEKLHTALKDSGFDEKRYDLDPATLAVKEKEKVVVEEKK